MVTDDDNIKTGEVYEIEGIINHRGNGKNIQYLVRWKGYSKDADSWLPADRFTHLPTIGDYRKRIGKKS